MESKVIEDAIMAGILGVLDCEITPTKNPDGKVRFVIYGDYDKAMDRLYGNDRVPVLDVLKSIKSCRTAIFSLKGRGNNHGS